MIIDFQFRAKTTDFRELLTSSIPECLLVTTRRFQRRFFFLIFFRTLSNFHSDLKYLYSLLQLNLVFYPVKVV